MNYMNIKKKLIWIFTLVFLAGEFLGTPVLSDSMMLITVGVLALIGFIAGVFPALKAATVEPVESLRYE
jgi:putative ABC transport system permease protein